MDDFAPTVPPKVRTGAYLVGIVVGVGVGPSLAAFGLDSWTAVASAVAGAASVIAFGYRPTRNTGDA